MASGPPEPDPTFVPVEAALAGTWRVELVGDDAPDLTLTLELELAEDGRVRGSVTSVMGTAWITEGDWKEQGQAASFGAITDFGRLGFSARVEQGALGGTMSAMGSEMEIRGQQQ